MVIPMRENQGSIFSASIIKSYLETSLGVLKSSDMCSDMVIIPNRKKANSGL